MSIPNKHSHIVNDPQHAVDSNARLPRFSGAWKKTSMGNIGSVYAGLSGKSKSDFEGGNARYVTFLGVLENVILDDRNTNSVHVRPGELQNSVLKGDLLFNASSETPGDLAIGAVMGQQLDNLYLNSFCFGFRIRDKKEYLPLFLAYYFRGSVGRAIMNVLAQGSTRYNMSKGQFIALELSFPPWHEQRAIAEVLSHVDGLIGALDALIAKKRAIKQATMQQLLTGRTRLPGFSRAWETKRLGEIVSIRNQKVLSPNVDPDTLCVELDHIRSGNGRLLECSTAQHSTSSKYRFFAGDVLFGRLRSYLRKFWHADRDGICTTEIWPLMVDTEQIDGRYLHAIVQTDSFAAAASISYGTHMPRTDWGVMQNLEVRLPQVREQHAIAAVLSDMDAEITALEHRRDKTRAIKQGMMQQLLTGSVRLVKSGMGA